MSLWHSHLHRKNRIVESYALKLDCPGLGTNSVAFVNLLIFQFSFLYDAYLKPVMVRT